MQERALALPSLAQLPAGVTQTTIGDAEAMAELFESFGLAMTTGILCIDIVLVLLFKDFVQPVTILAALVLSIPDRRRLTSKARWLGAGSTGRATPPRL